MRYFHRFSLPEKISLSFSLFAFFSLVLFLLLVNITYFFIWYNDQKQQSFSDMDITYNSMNFSQDQKSRDAFQAYLMTQDTMIIPQNGELICSPSVSSKIKEAPEEIQDRYFYKDGDTTYFIYSKYFEGIGEVKVFFDTTQYINDQVTIMKVSLIFILLMFLVQYAAGKYVTKILLRPLRSFSHEIRNIDIHAPKQVLTCNEPQHDELYMLKESFNTALESITHQTEKLKQFLTDVSHEFKTPLMVMSSKLDLLEKKAEKHRGKKLDIAAYFSESRREIHKMNSLLESLFLLSRVEENKMCLITQKLEVRNIFLSECETMRQKFPHKNIQINIDISESLYYQLEESTFRVCIANLLSNACKFSGEEVALTIHADTDTFSIWDNGRWILSWEREKIWQKFYRQDTKIEGFGIGLYLVKRISDMYGWEIVLSENTSQGTVFTFLLKHNNKI